MKSKSSFCKFLIFAWTALGVAGLAPANAQSTTAARAHIDRQFFRKSLIEDNLAHWLAASPTPSGLFRVNLDRQWRPEEKQSRNQERQVFAMITGYEVTGQKAYLDAARKGMEFGLANRQGKGSYYRAFIIFASSHAYRVTKDERFRKAALDTWAEMKADARDLRTLLKTETASDSPGTGTVRNSHNPLMHLFEALLALHDVTGSKTVAEEARALAEAMFTRVFQSGDGYLPENCDANWKPATDPSSAFIEIGHQFEWAYLLSHGVEKGVLPARYLDIGNRLLNYGMKAGYDQEHGGFYLRCDYQGRVDIRNIPSYYMSGRTVSDVRLPVKGFWEHCEAMRAMMHYAAVRGRTDLWGPFDKTLQLVKSCFMDPEYGGWYGTCEGNAPPQGAYAFKGRSWLAGYHISGMYREGLRLTGGLR